MVLLVTRLKMRRLLYNSVYLSWRLKLSKEQKKDRASEEPVSHHGSTTQPHQV
jgi:hypothetical protein